MYIYIYIYIYTYGLPGGHYKCKVAVYVIGRPSRGQDEVAPGQSPRPRRCRRGPPGKICCKGASLI